MFFGDWFSRHQQLVKNSSTFLVKATYFANFADVLRAYPRLDAVARIMEMKGQYIHLCQVWKTQSSNHTKTLPDPYRANGGICGGSNSR
ncbi:hypothetical protein PSHT_11662 [Puccinia striiformis]|uniref:Uncharacterized protein n=1 Tax=Puccinia striiformis TaxID=27350 RepID=A0A2S4V246_9BASI|nr:hypothetical protein PSHT_11662 [Puccinia striiformis]